MKSDELPSRKIRDIRGERFGRLTVTSFSHIAEHTGRNAFWNCDCDCGGTACVDSGALRTKSTKSCGCLASEMARVLIKKTHNVGAHLYFIRSGEYVKIGRTTNIKNRLAQLEAMNPHGVELINYLENEGWREKEFHEKFKDRHHRGEWFFLRDCDVN